MTTSDQTDSFPASNYGDFAGSFRADLDGAVHLAASAVKQGHWPGDYDTDDEMWAEEVAETNRDAKARADAALADWRGRGGGR